MDSFKTALVIIPPQEIWEPIQAVRKQYDEKITRWMPHITLLYPFYPKEEFSEFIAQVQSLCSEISSFEITLVGVSHFKQKRKKYIKYIIWANPQPQKEIKDLHKIIVNSQSQIAKQQRLVNRYNPHLTIGRVEEEEFEKVNSSLEKEWKPLAFTVEQIYLISREDPPNDIFEIQETISLGS